jgi:hypothetical protein
MADPLGLVLGFPTAAITDVEDVNGRPPWGALAAGPAATTTEAGDVDGGPRGLHGDNEVGSAKKMLVVISDPGRCWSRAPTACVEP